MNFCMLAYAHYMNDARIKNYVRTLESVGHRVDVIALRSGGESAIEELPNGTIFRIMDKYQGGSLLMYLWAYLVFFIRASFLLLRRSFSKRYDVVHVHNMPNALIFAALGPKILGARLMLDVHDLMTVNYMAKFHCEEDALPVRVLKVEQRLSAMLANHIFCADHNQRDYLIQNCGIAGDKITVLMNLPNIELFRPVTPKEKSDRFRIVYHGTIAYRLGIDLIIQAIAKAADQAPVELWMYGAGDFLPDVQELVAKLGIQKSVRLSGTFFPVEQIPEIVCGMDLGIIGNRRNLACDKYMLPVKLLEYVYLGVPVVAPRLAVIASYFDDTMVRFYEPENVDQMAESIVALYRDKAERERLIHNALAFYKTHNIEAQACRYLDLMTGTDMALPKQTEHPA